MCASLRVRELAEKDVYEAHLVCERNKKYEKNYVIEENDKEEEENDERKENEKAYESSCNGRGARLDIVPAPNTCKYGLFSSDNIYLNNIFEERAEAERGAICVWL